MRPYLLLVALLLITPNLRADETPISQRQAGVAERYARLEELLLRLAEVESAENPERSALLRRAARQSRDKFVLERLQGAAESLKTQEFQKAVDSQSSATEELGSLLKLLLSEDRSKRIRDEKERYQKLIKDLKRNLNNQRSTRARTENGADIDEVQKEQKSVTEKSESLSKELGETEEQMETGETEEPMETGEESRKEEKADTKEEGGEKEAEEKENNEEKDSAEGDSKPSDESSEPKPSDSKPSDSKPSESEQKPSDSKESSGKPQSGDQQSEPQQQQQQPQTPEQEVQKQLDQAIEKMKQAEQELEDAKREQATEKQREAEENLREAIDRLERILRQLREEELQRELAKLEARLNKMAAMQTKVLEDTIALAATPMAQRSRQTDLKAGDLAFEEKKITMEADRAMLLLREEGSSVAFPEVVLQIRTDTIRVADFLAETKIDEVTQGIQQDILAALEEMIAALQKAQRDLEKKKQQEQQGQPGQPGQGEQPLVESIAELKLIRTMETRIKSTTERYSGLLESGQTTGDDVLPLLQDLSERQSRLYRITRDLVLQRNQ